MQQFDPHTVSLYDPDKETTPAQRCLAELILHARQYRGCDWSVHGDRRTPGWAASEYLGVRDDGRPSWLFGCENDAHDFIDDALRIAASHGIEAEVTYHPDRNGTAVAMVRLWFTDEVACGHVYCAQSPEAARRHGCLLDYEKNHENGGRS